MNSSGKSRIVFIVMIVAVAVIAPKLYKHRHKLFEPTIDATTEESLEASISDVAQTLTATERESFKRATSEMVRRIMVTPPRADEEGLSMKERLLKRMHGKTYKTFMGEYYQTMIDFGQHRLKDSQDRLATLKAADASAEDIEKAEKDVEDFEHVVRNFRRKLSGTKVN